MTISSIGVRAVYSGSGSTGPFSLQDKDANPILFSSNDEIVVIKFNSDFESFLLTITLDYTLSGAGLSLPGNVTLTSALAVGETLVIYRTTQRTQELDLESGYRLSQAVIESNLDKIARINQEDKDNQTRSLKMPVYYTGDEVNFPIPDANKYIGWDEDGVLENKGIPNSIHAGSGVPSGSLGVDGDIYIDVLNKTMYGPKSTTWGAAISLVGPTGPTGPTGPIGGVAVAAGTQTATTGTVAFANSNGISFGMSNSSRITASHAVNVSAGTTSNNLSALTFSNSNNFSFGLNAGVVTGSYTVPSTAGLLSAIKVSAGTTSNNLSALTFSNSNGLSFGLNGSVVTGSYTVPTQTNQTLGLYHVGNTTGQSSSSTVDARTLLFSGAGVASVGMSGGAVVISVPAGGGAGDGYNILAAGTQTATTAGSVEFVNSNGVSFGMSGSTRITASHAVNVSAGTTTGAVSALTFSNSNNFSFGLNAGVVTGSYTVPTVTNSSASISAGTTSGTLGQLVFSNSNNVSFGLNAGTVTASVNAGGGAPNRSFIEVMNGGRFTSCAALSATQFSNRPMFFPFWVDGTGIELKTMRYFVSGVGSSNRSFGGQFHAGLYSQVNDTQLTLLASDSQSFLIALGALSTQWDGMNAMDFTGMSACTLTAEGCHVAAFMVSPMSANETWMSAQLWGGENFPNVSRFFVGGGTSATNNTSNLFPYMGLYSTTTYVLPGSVHKTQIYGGNSGSMIDAYCVIKGL